MKNVYMLVKNFPQWKWAQIQSPSHIGLSRRGTPESEAQPSTMRSINCVRTYTTLWLHCGFEFLCLFWTSIWEQLLASLLPLIEEWSSFRYFVCQGLDVVTSLESTLYGYMDESSVLCIDGVCCRAEAVTTLAVSLILHILVFALPIIYNCCL